MTDDHILFHVEDGVACLTFHRPAKHNAITAVMGGEITRRAKRIDTDPTIKALVVQGASGRAFSPDPDVSALDDLGTPWDGHACADYERDYMAQLPGLRKPAIAAIDGHCLCGGLEMALFCDIRIATPNSTFGAPEIQRGWYAGSSNVSILPRVIGYGNAALWLLTRERAWAEEAHRVGLAQRIVAKDDLSAEAQKIAARIAKNSPIAVQSAKQGQGTSIAQGLARENDGYTLCMMTEDDRKDITAFVEKREPVFWGR